MPYVMVPVPEDQVQEVMQFVVRLMSQASVEPWTEETIAQVFEEIDELGRAFLSTVAKAAVDGKTLSEGDVAAIIAMNWREAMGILRELNDLAQAAGHPQLVARRVVTETLPNGRTREVRVLAMSEDIARMVHEADRAQLLADGHPLGGERR
jgi:hypothetical protein